jgi:general transcription factor 3C polypeptide 6
MSSNLPSTSLFPGYTQVEEFGPDEEYESEEEVVYVTLDLGNVEPTLVPNSSAYRLIVCMNRGFSSP